MDRFIAKNNYIPYIPKYSLKSNMDRFIGVTQNNVIVSLFV
mgnify:CR=1 FL=1